MELNPFFFFFLIFSLLWHSSYTQQPYLGNNGLNCSNISSDTIGYACNGPQKSCKSFVTFRSLPPYDSPVSIAYLLGSEASEIAMINNISDVDKIPSNKQVIVPVSCSCVGKYYQHNTPYTIKYRGETYFNLANSTYQGLTTCAALRIQNPSAEENLIVGEEVMVPVRCACPTENQTRYGVTFLMTYMIATGNTIYKISGIISSIPNIYGVSMDSILEANELSITTGSLIYAFTSILVPLKSESCRVNPNNFFCYCPNGYLSDGRDSRICVPDPRGFPTRLAILLGVTIGSVLLCLSVCGYWLYRYLKKRKHLKHKGKLFIQNGGLLLKEKISSFNDGVERAKIFTEEELQRATDNYNKSRVLGRGGYGTVYKGMLPDGRIVAVKKSKGVDSSRIQQFVNEVAILTQINHRNVVKLLGCCLETKIPLLVYEFISNGTLSHHIHSNEVSLSWANRLRIASEVAGALSYLHSAASIPIFHRDVKSSNILLDEKYNAKLADFGTSRTIPFGDTHLTTTVQGTFGYLDPEYFQTSQFNEKSDVYSFGVVLVELLTGGKPINFARAEDEINLVSHFISLMEDDKLMEIVDRQIMGEAKEEEILGIANIASRCLRLEGKRRPTMKEVAMEIEGLRKNQKSLQIHDSFIGNIGDNGKETQEILSIEMESSLVDIST